MKKLATVICLASLTACGGGDNNHEEIKDEINVDTTIINGVTTVNISGNSAKEVLPKKVALLKVLGRNHVICAETVDDLKINGDESSIYAAVATFENKGSGNKIEPYSRCPLDTNKSSFNSSL